MPTYEYRCPECKHEFELFQRMSDEPKAECPNCGAMAERRLSAGAGLLFKGSGFYITDYRSDSYKKAAGSEGGGGGEKSEAKGEKSEPKGEKASGAKESSSGGKGDSKGGAGGSKSKAE